MSEATYIVGDVFDVLATIPTGSVDLVMTSPPFLALRSYLPDGHPDKGRELGSEPDPAAFLGTLLALTGEWQRVLAPHGSICVELGDTYAGSTNTGGDWIEGSGIPTVGPRRTGEAWPLNKSLCMIPALYAASLAYGRNLLTGEPSPTGRWRVRNLVAWVRPNPPVGSLGDKVRPATSYLTWATKSADRWFDLDAVRMPTGRFDRGGLRRGTPHGTDERRSVNGESAQMTGSNPAGAPPLDWWNIPPRGYTGSHYAVYPAELCRIPIEASCPRRVCTTCGTPSRRQVEAEYVKSNTGKAHTTTQTWNQERRTTHPKQAIGEDNGVTRNTTTVGWSTCGCPGADGIRLDGYHTGPAWRPGVVLDPFAGTGTTLLAATGQSRDAIGIDLDERNADLARERLGMFLAVEDHTANDEMTGT